MYAQAASALLTVFVFVFPTFVGLLAARFLIYEQTIAVGALWSLLLLAGILLLVDRATTSRLMLVCGAAGLILETLGNAWRFRDRVRKMRGAIAQDIVGSVTRGLEFLRGGG